MSLLALTATGTTGAAGAEAGAGGRGGGHALFAPHPLIGLALPLDTSLSDDVEAAYDRYSALKTLLQTDANIGFSMPVSTFVQSGAPNGGPAVAEIVYSPELTWTPFSGTAIGSGTFTFAMQGNQFWTGANTGSQQDRMGLLTPPNGWDANEIQFLQLTYTHTFPGNWLAVSVGQYAFSQYDGNANAGNPQASFTNYALSQNGTQAYANAGTGAYVQITPNNQLQFAAGFQGATDIAGSALTINGLGDGSIASFIAAQWTPAFLAGGAYALLYYSQPSVPQQPSAAQGISFSASQGITARTGVFLRINNASGAAIPIETSVALGGVVNDPFGRNHGDQAGLGFAWDKTNMAFVDAPVRRSEQLGEVYYNFAVFKALSITPDVQVYVRPALSPDTGLAAVFTLRTTINF